jgi:hypothetical protein
MSYVLALFHSGPGTAEQLIYSESIPESWGLEETKQITWGPETMKSLLQGL